jgi:hypothetical protein
LVAGRDKKTKDYIQEPVTFLDQIDVSFKAATQSLGGPRKWKKTLTSQAEVLSLKISYYYLAFILIALPHE